MTSVTLLWAPPFSVLPSRSIPNILCPMFSPSVSSSCPHQKQNLIFSKWTSEGLIKFYLGMSINNFCWISDMPILIISTCDINRYRYSAAVLAWWLRRLSFACSRRWLVKAIPPARTFFSTPITILTDIKIYANIGLADNIGWPILPALLA